MNPFCVVVAQGIPAFRCFLAPGCASWCGLSPLDWPDLYHGVRLTSEKESSSARVHESDRFFREKQADVEQRRLPLVTGWY